MRSASVFTVGGDAGDDTYGGTGGGRIEADLDLHVVDGALPGQSPPRLPSCDSGQLQGLTGVVVVNLQQPAAHAGLAAHGQNPPTCMMVDRPSDPPQVEFFGESFERRPGFDRHLDHEVTDRSSTSPLSDSLIACSASRHGP
jgi:hypothetical protein